MTDENKSTAPLSEHIRGVQDQVAIAHGRIDELFDRLDSPPAPQNLKDLYTALAKAQGEITSAELDAEGQAGTRKYQYATLSSVLTAIRAPLSKNGLSISQLPCRGATPASLGLTTILAHESGQSLENYFEMDPPKLDPQGIGSAMTYMRRYALMAIIGVAGANDDDAEGAKAEPETITAAQVDTILSMADDLFGDDSESMLQRMCEKVFDVEAVAKIPAAGYEPAQNSLNNQHKRLTKKPAKPSA